MSTHTTADEFDATTMKAIQREVWADGDYALCAATIDEVPPAKLLEAVDVGGRDVLDVATGTGNLALAAARAGARVVGLDLTPRLLEVAAQRSVSSGLEVQWIEGDAEALGFAAESFDVVASVFGVQFTPRSRRAAAEMLRVCRPGGTVAVLNWTPEGLIGQLWKIMASYLPAPPPGATSPGLWGSEAHLRELFADAAEISFTRATNPFRFASIEEYMEFFEVNYGPTKRAKEALSAAGRWDELQGQLRALYGELNQARDGTLHIESEFVLCVARKRAG